MVISVEERRRVAELLPFYVNGTLSADERTEVDALLAEDEALRQEVALLNHIRDAIKADAPDFSPGELGLARLTRAISNEKAEMPRRRFGRDGGLVRCGDSGGRFGRLHHIGRQ